jgi:hypothetical protein
MSDAHDEAGRSVSARLFQPKILGLLPAVSRELDAEVAEEYLSTEETARYLSSLGVVRPRVPGVNALPDGSVVVVKARTRYAVRRLSRECAAALRDSETRRHLSKVHSAILAVIRSPGDARARRTAEELLETTALQCDEDARGAAAELLEALRSWRSSGEEVPRAASRLQEARQLLQQSRQAVAEAKRQVELASRQSTLQERRREEQVRGLAPSVSARLRDMIDLGREIF